MMNGVEVEVAFDGNTDGALGAVASELEKLGYELKKNEGGSLQMKFKGKWFTSDPAKMRHQVTVKSGGGKLEFAFGTGMIASHWSDEDKAWAQGRADEVVAAARAQLS